MATGLGLQLVAVQLQQPALVRYLVGSANSCCGSLCRLVSLAFVSAQHMLVSATNSLPGFASPPASKHPEQHTLCWVFERGGSSRGEPSSATGVHYGAACCHTRPRCDATCGSCVAMQGTVPPFTMPVAVEEGATHSLSFHPPIRT